MEDFIGLPSLLFACLGLLLLINALVYSQKNTINYFVFALAGIFAIYHLNEFLICFVGIDSQIILLINFSMISFAPPLSLSLAIRFWNLKTYLNYILFLPSLALVFVFMNSLGGFKILQCSYLYIGYNFPLRTELGVLFYLMHFASALLLAYKLREAKPRYKRHISISLLIGIATAFIPPFFITLMFPNTNIYSEGILGKFSFLYVLSLTYFSLKNKTELLSDGTD